MIHCKVLNISGSMCGTNVFSKVDKSLKTVSSTGGPPLEAEMKIYPLVNLSSKSVISTVGLDVNIIQRRVHNILCNCSSNIMSPLLHMVTRMLNLVEKELI